MALKLLEFQKRSMIEPLLIKLTQFQKKNQTLSVE